MKRLLVIIVIISMAKISLNAQDSLTPNQILTEDVSETVLTKNVMWINLKKWVSSQFNKYKYVVDLEDKESGSLVVKWSSMFTPTTTNCIALTASATYQIDVKDKKYRIKVLDTKVSADANVGNVSNMSYDEISEVQDDLKFLIRISMDYFNGSPCWDINNNFNSIIVEYESKLSKLPQYKDKKQTKLNKEWKRCDRDLKLLKDVYSGFEIINSALYDSLKKAIIFKDDF